VAVDAREDTITLDGEDLAGDPLAVQDFRGKPVVLVVWGSWCAPCRDEAPEVVAAAKELGDDVQFVGINIRDASSAQAQAFTRKFDVDFPSFYSPSGEALLAFPGVLGLRTIPAFAVLDAEGRVAASIIGKLPSQQTLVDVTKDVVDESRDVPRDG
jgi:thiol-disulfide isomerase/thioredoxin